LGEGNEVHLNALREGQTRKFQAPVNIGRFADYPVHALGEVSFDTQIQKKSDQRQMEPWQRIGTYAAGAALEHAGVKGQAELLARTHMIVAAGGGERDADGADGGGWPDAAAL
jgi:3-oxoacyl-[acyl-carrier-protein] synthase II